jgi:hypothetical protein
MSKLLIVLFCMVAAGSLGGCVGHVAQKTYPFGVWDGGMRMPTDQACAIRPNANGTTDLTPCRGSQQ